MKKVALTLLIAAFLSSVACSRSKTGSQETTPTPDPDLKSRMQQQQQAIQRAAEERRKEAERSSGQPASSPSPH
jgi:hypothetical protein